ncbi:MAG TPA: class I SAM-dependent methyltransferase [Casimicrobiaceae bacterium]|nr:class I SAM-dependent methyltransferase [Casimicrobiaceae bacterium]
MSAIRFVCPACRSDVRPFAATVGCTGCGRRFDRIHGEFADFAPETSFDEHWTLDPDSKRRWLEEEAPREEAYEEGLARRYVRPLLERLRLGPASAILSAGCGLGADVDMLIGEGYDAWGIDIGNRVLRWGARAHRERLARGDIRFMPFADEAFDFVLSLNTIEHIGTIGDSDRVAPDYLEQRRSAVRDLLRVTKPGGYVLLSGLSRTIPFDFGHVQDHGFVRIHSPWERFLLNFADIRRLCEETGQVQWTRPQPLRGFFAWTRLGRHPVSRPLLPFVDWLFGSLPPPVYGWGICPFYIALARKA